ncbi:MAG: hypothetical protein BGO98_27285 [Myxococcales bacterium 68-20]|nr:hypothetical protein [Myxococcales bacterium]OJY30427.1 MAG: hypothetical protein BGO98_27285 [Myxococcales bacterium 68-20]
MKTRWLFVVAGAAGSLHAAALLAACATDSEVGAPPPDEANAPIPATDAGSDSDDADGAVCVGEDCEFYPAECTDDALCAGGLFNPSDPSGNLGLDLRTHITALAARSPTDVWVAGTVGQLGHFDGTSWRPSSLGTQQSIWGLWLYGNAEIAFDEPSRLYTRGLDAGADASTSADGWSFVGAATLSGTWNSRARVMATWAHPNAASLWVGVDSPSYGGGLWRMRRDAETGTFTAIEMPFNSVLTNVHGLFGLSADELWAVGTRGAACRITNAESDTPTFTTFNALTMMALEGVWAASSNDVWAVGSTGTVRRYRGDARFWEIYEEVPTKQHLLAIAGSSPKDIWIVGDAATVFHYDGASWKRVKIAGLGQRRPRLEHVWVPSPGKVWIAGQGVLVSLGGKP